MHLAKVIGNVVATVKYEGLEGIKLLVIQPLDHNLLPGRAPLTAVDTVQAGEGDLIYFVEGREATFALEKSSVPVDAAIVGIVDNVNVASFVKDRK